MKKTIDEKDELTNKLLGSFLLFTQNFYLERTGRRFEVTFPIGRESHIISIAKALTKVLRGETSKLIINVPPRYGKTELLIHFVAWAIARYPDSHFLYVSYSHSLAKKQTQTIRDLIQLPMYNHFFGVKLKGDTSAKDNFETDKGGSVYAAGAGGTITGRGAGIKGCHRFGGCIVIDDIHKPDEAHSDTIRENVNEWYYNTLQSRINSPKTPIIFIGQRVHEDDLAANLIKTGEWETLIIPALDEAGNALNSEMHDKKALLKLKEFQPYVFSAQYQQDPQPSGGGIFKPEWFIQYEFEPDVITTFLTVDSAETDKDYNDATVFSFWGIYKIKLHDGVTDSGLYGLHWIDCLELRVEPKDLEPEFLNFYANCMRHSVKPQLVAIEKKSTGVTLLSILKNYQGLRLLDIERTRSSGNKTARFLEAQPIIAAKRISLPKNAKHTTMCIDHCRKITANNTHRFDDIADTLYDAIKIALIDKLMIQRNVEQVDYSQIASQFSQKSNQIDRLRKAAYGK